MNNIFLCAAASSVFIGTLYPLALETLNGAKISVGPPYFNLTFGPIILPLLLLVPFGPLLTWKRGDALAVMQRLWWAAALALLASILVYAFGHRGPWAAPLGIGLGVWLIIGSLTDLANRMNLGRTSLSISLQRLMGLQRSIIGTVMAHAGVGLLVIGIVAASLWKEEQIVSLKPGGSVGVAGYTVTFVSEQPIQGPNYSGRSGTFKVSRNDTEITTLVSEKRMFKPSGANTQVGLYQTLLGDLYIVMGDEGDGGSRVVRASFNPMVSWMWAGAFLMFAGGVMSLSDRRFRIGVPKRAVAKPA